MNPYEPPKEPPKMWLKEQTEPKVPMSFNDFGAIVFCVIVGTPIIYGTILELVERYLP